MESDAQHAWLNRYEHSMMHVFGTPKRVFATGHGCELIDVQGRIYTDMFSGIAVGGLGHAHPAIVRAVTEQMETLGHISNLFASRPQILLAEKLTDLVKQGLAEHGAHCSTASASGSAGPRQVPADLPVRVYFGNSGAEANETAFKITRLTGRTKVIAMEGSFHGRTMGALALTSTQKYREPFEPLPGEVVFVPFGDAEALAGALDEQTAAVVLEPIQGESGVHPAPDGYLREVERLCRSSGALMWVDEVQSGMGRSGDWFASIAEGVRPDIITLAKGLGNGMPISATIALGEAAELLHAGQHGSTFGGNPVACAAGLAVIQTIEDDGLLPACRERGAQLRTLLEGLHPAIDHVRGRGLLIGIQLTAPIGPQVVEVMLTAGWIINAPRPDVLRLAPPLIVDEMTCQLFAETLRLALDTCLALSDAHSTANPSATTPSNPTRTPMSTATGPTPAQDQER